MRSLFLVLAVIGLWGTVSNAKANASLCSHMAEPTGGGGGGGDLTPWPSSIVRPFPWDDVQGLWKVEDDKTGDVWFFALKRLRITPSCERPLQVRQIDGSTCKVVATGVGFDHNKVVRAQMNSRDGKTYRIAFTAFNQEDAPMAPIEGKIHLDSVVVLSMANVDSPLNSDVRHMQIVKVSNTLDIRTCTQDIKR